MLNKKKKVKYIPDEDVLAYGRKQDTEALEESVNNSVNGNAELDVSTETTETENISQTVIEDTTPETEEITEKIEKADTPETVTEYAEIDEDAAKPKKKNIFLRILGTIFPKKGDRALVIVLKIVSLVACIALIASACYLSYYYVDIEVQNQVIDRQRAIYDLNRYDYQTSTAEGYLAKFSELKRQNNDLIGWITINGTEVDNPVYQRDNEFYLNHDMYGKVNSYGSIFLDERCDAYPSRTTQNQIIYGHNMRYGAMFGTLDEYRDIEYYRQHPTIVFDSLWEHKEYKIFAIMITNDSTDNTFGYSFTPYRSNFVNQEDFLLWTEYCKQRSLYDIDVDIKPDDEVITLSTCCYDFDEARFILVGRLVREDESSEVDVDSAIINEDVIYSREYYEKKKKPIPEIEPPTVNIYDR